MKSFKAPRKALTGLDAETVSSLITASTDVALVLDAKGVVRDAAFGSEVLAAQPLDLQRQCVLAGGDDYELLLAVPPACENALRDASATAGIPVTRIGTFHSGAPEVTVLDGDGRPLDIAKGGWSHF